MRILYMYIKRERERERCNMKTEIVNKTRKPSSLQGHSTKLYPVSGVKNDWMDR